MSLLGYLGGSLLPSLLTPSQQRGREAWIFSGCASFWYLSRILLKLVYKVSIIHKGKSTILLISYHLEKFFQFRALYFSMAHWPYQEFDFGYAKKLGVQGKGSAFRWPYFLRQSYFLILLQRIFWVGLL